MSDEYLEISLDDLRVREIEDIEEKLGMPIDECFKKGKGKALRAIGYVLKRRDNPEFTWEDAGELIVRLSEPDPTPAA